MVNCEMIKVVLENFKKYISDISQLSYSLSLMVDAMKTLGNKRLQVICRVVAISEFLHFDLLMSLN